MVDFNSVDLAYDEYREMAHKILLKYYKKYEPDYYYSDDMIDFVTDKLINKDKKYNSEKGSRSNYRYLVCMTNARNYYQRIVKEQRRLRRLSVKEYTTENNIDKQEKKRLHDIALRIIKSNMKKDIGYRYFYELAVNEKSYTVIANEFSKTPTTISNQIGRVREQLKKTLVEVYGAE